MASMNNVHHPQYNGDDDNGDLSSLIDPSLLAGLSESERHEALAAAAAAKRAERRAEERARQRQKQREAAASSSWLSSDVGPAATDASSRAAASSTAKAVVGENGHCATTTSTTTVASEEEEEQRLLAEALERRLQERQRERDAERARLQSMMSDRKIIASGNINNGIAINGLSTATEGTGSGGLQFVSKKKRGVGQLSIGQEDTYTSGIRPLAKKLEKDNVNQKQQHQPSDPNASAHESHLTASQLASIKKAYLGEKAVISESSTNNNNAPRSTTQSSNATQLSTQSIRQQLREQRMKRRVKKATFKFEWGAEEDTFEDDDPLYGGSATTSSGKIYQQQQPLLPGQGTGGIGRPSNFRSQTHLPSPLDGEIKFGKKKMRSNNDAIATVDTVATKPLDKMTPRDWRIYRENFNIVVKGGKSPPPLRSFREMPVGVPPIHPSLLDAIENKLQYKTPSPIQRQAIPIGMQRRDMIGIAETGSGKTAAFGVPLCHHVLCFPPSILNTVAEEGPLALVMAPTRELALQINVEFGKLLSSQRNVVSLAIVGGQSITEQATKLRNGVHVVVGTPGRINDCVEMAYLVLNQCSYIVLDEADRMIDLGFAPQIEQILDAMGAKLKSEDESEAYRQEREDLEILGKAVPSHRLTAMFSATMPSEVERIAKRYLRHPVVVSVGDQDSGKNTRITQRVLFLSSPGQKENTLRDLLRRAHPNEKIIVFVNEKKHADGVGRMVEKAGRQCVVLHGGKTQEQREENLAMFRRGGVVLVATDVAGRGLDIPDVNQVINYDLPTRSIDNYCHRIGRTGRAGKEGIATSFITDEDEGIMAPLKQYLESTGMTVPDRLARHPAASGSGEFIR
ncbi:hypothetical protein ACHAXH_008234 [Discostella pseudostelligera]